MKNEIKIVAFSDTHGQHSKVDVPDGDVLVFAGDLMTCGRKFWEVESFASWFMAHPHPHKILVAGNHDRMFEHPITKEACVEEFEKRNTNHFYYLNDSGCQIRGWNFWGSPIQPWFCNWAFNRARGPEINKHWNMIPDNTDILITHGPPLGIGDGVGAVYAKGKWEDDHVGCADLLKTIQRIKPAMHIFGHIHNGAGMYQDVPETTWFHNVSICDESYKPVNQPHTRWFAERE